MGYHLDFTEKAKEDIAAHQKAGNKAALNKLLKLLDELANTLLQARASPRP